MRIQSLLLDHARIAEAVAEGFVRAAMVIISAGLAPLDPLDIPTLRYQLEPPGQEDWKLPNYVIRDGWGDCEDLAFWRAAGMRLSGEDPDARVRIVKTGEHKLHAIVELADGSFSDPSLDLIRRQRGNR